MEEHISPLGPSSYTAPQPTVEEDSGISFGDIFRALAKGKWLILSCVFVCVFIAGMYDFIKRPVYEATATLRIDPTRAGSLGFNDAFGTQAAADELQTDIAMIESDEVTVAALKGLTPEQFTAFTGETKDQLPLTAPDQRFSRAEESAISDFKGSVDVKQVEGTQLLDISFEDQDPKFAAAAANSVVNAYLRLNFDSRYESVSQVRTWLSGQMNDLRNQAAAAQKRLADFQEQNNLLGSDVSNNTTMDTLRSLNSRVSEAESDRIVKEAQMRAAQSGDPEVLATLMSDAHLQALESDEANLFVQYQQLSAKFGPAYPPLANVKQQLAQVRDLISKDVNVISRRLTEDYEAAVRIEQLLRSEYADATTKAYALNRTQAEYNVLIADVNSSRDLYDSLQVKLQQASVDAGLNAINLMVVDRARPPLLPVQPKKTLILAFGLLLGLMAGVGAALLRESGKDEILHLPEIESKAGMIALAGIPPHKSNLIALEGPRSQATEAYRNLRNAIQIFALHRGVKTVLFTSPLPKESKSVTVANYAIVLAQNSSKVLLVDADLRRPSLHTLFGVSNAAGVSEALADGTAPSVSAPLASVPSLHLLSAGNKNSAPSETLASAKFQSMIERLAAEYDVVVLDSAPLLTVSDTLPLTMWIGSVVLVVRSGMTPLKALLRAKLLLGRARANVAGVVLTGLDEIGEASGFHGQDGHDYYF